MKSIRTFLLRICQERPRDDQEIHVVALIGVAEGEEAGKSDANQI